MGEVDVIVSRIEQKLQELENRRSSLAEAIHHKKLEIEKLEDALDKLRALQAKLADR